MARSETNEMQLTLDYNSEIYPLKSGERITLMLATSLSPHGADDEAAKSWRPDRESDGIDKDFEYVMYGKVSMPGVPLCRNTEVTLRRYTSLMRERTIKCAPRLWLCFLSALTIHFSTAYVSYGGLLMALSGSYRHMQGIVLGDNVYLLIRR
jgi:DNA-directed RNA polymerase I, II, and III subunit RPABC3